MQCGMNTHSLHASKKIELKNFWRRKPVVLLCNVPWQCVFINKALFEFHSYTTPVILVCKRMAARVTNQDRHIALVSHPASGCLPNYMLTKCTSPSSFQAWDQSTNCLRFLGIPLLPDPSSPLPPPSQFKCTWDHLIRARMSSISCMLIRSALEVWFDVISKWVETLNRAHKLELMS